MHQTCLWIHGQGNLPKQWRMFSNKQHRIRHVTAGYSLESVCEGSFMKSIHHGLFKCKEKKIHVNCHPAGTKMIYPVTSWLHLSDLMIDFIFQSPLLRHVFKCSFVQFFCLISPLFPCLQLILFSWCGSEPWSLHLCHHFILLCANIQKNFSLSTGMMPEAVLSSSTHWL